MKEPNLKEMIAERSENDQNVAQLVSAVADKYSQEKQNIVLSWIASAGHETPGADARKRAYTLAASVFGTMSGTLNPLESEALEAVARDIGVTVNHTAPYEHPRSGTANKGLNRLIHSLYLLKKVNDAVPVRGFELLRLNAEQKIYRQVENKDILEDPDSALAEDDYIGIGPAKSLDDLRSRHFNKPDRDEEINAVSDKIEEVLVKQYQEQ